MWNPAGKPGIDRADDALKDMKRAKLLPVALWVARLTAALILLQTLFFKFTGAPESVYIFQKIGLEPLGRYGSGVVELVAAILLLLPSARLTVLGAGLALATMSGAILFHLTSLGVEVQGDGGILFAMALVVLISAAFVFTQTLHGLKEWTALVRPRRGAGTPDGGDAVTVR